MKNSTALIVTIVFLALSVTLLYWGWGGLKQSWVYIQSNFSNTFLAGALIALVCTYWLSRSLHKSAQHLGRQQLAVERSRLFNECLLYVSKLRQLSKQADQRYEWEMKLKQFKPFFGLHASPNSIRLLQNWENLAKDQGYQSSAADAVLTALVRSLRADLGTTNLSLLDEDIMPLLEVREEYINGREPVH